MDVSLFDYDLPEELIAQFPSRRRDQSRLLVVDRQSPAPSHHAFANIVDFVRPGDVLVVNNTKVFKARLYGKRKTGGKVELFLVRPIKGEDEDWLTLVFPGRRLHEGEDVFLDDNHAVRLEEKFEDGSWRARFGSRTARERIISHFGHVPLPHYISRDDQPSDIRRYQTVFASSDKVGAVAAPTAGFHFTKPILRALEEKGVRVVEVTLHVGPGTFRPIKVDNIYEHTVDPEWAELSPETAQVINEARATGNRIIAVGTTSTRTLESARIEGGKIRPFSGMVNLYIKPGHEFRVVDALVTNFHLPKSSLLVLVSALAGRERILSAYATAIEHRYRFYSYGDAMLIL